MQAAPTDYTMQKVDHFLDYMASNPDALVRFYVSDMVLKFPFGRELPDGDAGAKQSGRTFLPRLHPKRLLPDLPQRQHPN